MSSARQQKPSSTELISLVWGEVGVAGEFLRDVRYYFSAVHKFTRCLLSDRDDLQSDVQRSLRYGQSGQRTTWSPTYQRIFRSFYPDGAWKELEKEKKPMPSCEFHTNRSESWEPQETTRAADIRSTKRVSINEDEARSELTKRSLDRQFSEPSPPLDVDDVLVDNEVIAFVREVLKKEFPDGKLNFIKSQDEPVETIFKKTLKFNGKDKTVYVHLRNGVSTRADHDFHKNTDSSSKATTFSPQISVTPPHSECVGDSGAHTKASSWTGPHVPTPVPSMVSSNTFHRSFSSIPKRDGPYRAEVRKPIVDDSESLEGPADALERKLTRKEPLDRRDFLAFKQIHCNHVVEDEEELARLLRIPQKETGRVRLLRERLDDRYRTYEEILETARPSSTALLAHRILLADAYLFHARIKQTNRRYQRKLYHMATDIYRELLNLARRCLPADDASVITIAERLSSILAESRSLQPELLVEITAVIDNAEQSLDGKSESELRRKIRRARQNLGALGAYYYAYV